MTEDLPRTIENPLTGERVTFLATAEETNGEYVRIRNEVPAGAPGVVMHYHLAYTEAFEVLKGRLDMCVGVKMIVTTNRAPNAPKTARLVPFGARSAE
jgi:hypothetical protein